MEIKLGEHKVSLENKENVYRILILHVSKISDTVRVSLGVQRYALIHHHALLAQGDDAHHQ